MIWRFKPLDIFFVFLISVLPLIIFLPSFFKGIVAGGDIGLYWFYGSLIKESVLKFGQLPLWNPYYTSGAPLDGNSVTTFFYPPTWLFLFFNEVATINVLIVGHLILLGESAYFFARSTLNLSATSSFLVSLGIMLTPKVFNHIYGGHYAFVFAFAWVPIVFFLIFRIVKSAKIIKDALLLGLVFSLMYFSMIQVAFYTFFIFLLYLLYELFLFHFEQNFQIKRTIKEATRLAKVFLSTLFFFVGFSAISLLPTLFYAQNSVRKGLTLFESAIPAIYPDTFLKLFYIKPDAFEPFEVVIYVGILTLIFAVIGIFKGRDKRILFLLLLATFAAFFSLGANGSLYRVFYYLVPGFSWFRGPIRIWFFFAFSASILAGFGVDWLLNLKVVKKIAWVKFTFASLLIFLFFGHLWLYDKDYSKPHQLNEITRFSPILENLPEQNNLFRIYSVDRSTSYIEAKNKNLHYADGGDVAPLKNYSDFINASLNYHYEGYSLSVPPNQVIYPESRYYQKPNPDPNLLGMLNVKYIISPENLENLDLEFKKEIGRYRLYENKRFLPRAFVVGNLKSVSKLDPYTLRGFDLRSQAIVEGQLNSKEIKNDFYKEAEITFYSPNEVKIKVNLDKEGLLVLADTYYPGWKAFDNGSLVKIYKTNAVVRGVILSRGDHNLRFIYDPPLFKLGLVISGATLIITLFILKKRV